MTLHADYPLKEDLHISFSPDIDQHSQLAPIDRAPRTPTAQLEPPKLTLDPEKPIDWTPGFHRFVRGARIEWPQESIEMSYLLYLPQRIVITANKLPLMIFLHGDTHQGTDLEGVWNEGPGFYLQTDHEFHDWFPMIGVFPQLPFDWRWDTPGAPQAVNALIKQMCIKYSQIDQKRIYLTGLSMGGKGCWLTALDAPDTFAAMTTFSAVAVRPEQAKTKLAGLENIHIICGTDDGNFAAGSRQMFDALHATLGNRVQFTAVQHEGHRVWARYYSRHEVYEELMRFSK